MRKYPEFHKWKCIAVSVVPSNDRPSALLFIKYVTSGLQENLFGAGFKISIKHCISMESHKQDKINYRAVNML